MELYCAYGALFRMNMLIKLLAGKNKIFSFEVILEPSRHLKGTFEVTWPWVDGCVTRFSAKASKPVYVAAPSLIKWQHHNAQGQGSYWKRRAEDSGPGSRWTAVALASQFTSTQLPGNYLKTSLKDKSNY